MHNHLQPTTPFLSEQEARQRFLAELEDLETWLTEHNGDVDRKAYNDAVDSILYHACYAAHLPLDELFGMGYAAFTAALKIARVPTKERWRLEDLPHPGKPSCEVA